MVLACLLYHCCIFSLLRWEGKKYALHDKVFHVLKKTRSRNGFRTTWNEEIFLIFSRFLQIKTTQWGRKMDEKHLIQSFHSSYSIILTELFTSQQVFCIMKMSKRKNWKFFEKKKLVPRVQFHACDNSSKCLHI